VSFKILADIDFTESSEGVIVAQDSRFGGYTMFVKNGELVSINNFLCILIDWFIVSFRVVVPLSDPPGQRLRCARHCLVSQRSGCRAAKRPPCKLVIAEQEGWTSAKVGTLAEDPCGPGSHAD
jgi:hypothetical protein